MHKSLFLIVILFVSSVFGAEIEAQKWAEQLQSPIPAQREQATKALIELGPESGIVLPDSQQQGLPADVKRRIEKIRKVWEGQNAQSFLQSSVVPSKENLSLQDWLTETEKTTGNPIDFKRVPEDTLSGSVGELKSSQFWTEIDQTVCHNKLKYSWFERPKAVRLQPGGTGKLGPTVYQGPFRLEVQEWGTTVRPADPNSSTIRAGLILAWEPRLRPIYIDIQPTIKYSDGSTQTGESIQILGGEGTAKPIDFIFPLTTQTGAKPTTLSGEFSVVIAGESKTFSFPVENHTAKTATTKTVTEKIATTKTESSTAQQSQRQDKAVVVLKSVRRTDLQTATAQIAVEFDESYNGLRSYMTWLNYNKAYAVDENGNRYESSNWETVWQSERGAEAKYYFTIPKDAQIRQIEYFTPTAIRRIEYSFNFEKIFSNN